MLTDDEDTTFATYLSKLRSSSCGCAARKDIMFGTGVGASEGIILAGALILLLAAWRLSK